MKKHLHERRKIAFEEYGALLATRELLKRGDLGFAPNHTCALPHQHLFNMSIPGEVRGCGTIGCIGGTMAHIMGVKIHQYVSMSSGFNLETDYVFSRYNEYPFCSKALGKLFYPSHTGSDAAAMNWKWVTPKIAVKAIDNWLKTGKPNWKSLVPAKLRTKRA